MPTMTRKRRTAGEGSVYRRGKTGPWMAQLSAGGRGQRRYERRTAREAGHPDSRRGALAALEDLKAERRDGLQPSRQSLGDYLRSWLDETARPAISANTYRGYEDVLAHLAPIADIPLRDLTAEDLERAFNHMVVRRGKRDEPASAKTVRNAQIMVRKALRSAEMRGHVRRNVALQVPLRRVPRIPRLALTPDAARRILAAVTGDRYEAAFALALIGLREGEILGLAREDIDLESCTAAVRYELVGSGQAATRHQLKTAASEATVPLPGFVAARLQDHLARQRQERPDEAPNEGLVFVTERGYAVNGSWLTKHFQALLNRAGLPRMRLHDLRHGAASLLVGAGVHPRIAQELLRHASSKTTMEIYSHVSAAQQREAVEVLQRALAESHAESHAKSNLSGSEWPRVEQIGETERESGSGGRTRTYDQAVNSRPLYQLSYAGTQAGSIAEPCGTPG
jgi:integrase